VKLPTKPPFFETVLNILGYRENGEWVALALEMDLRGYGRTFEEALSDLRDLVSMQMGFALSKGKPEMIFKNAEPHWFQLFADFSRAKLVSALTSSRKRKNVADQEYQTGGLSLPAAHVIAQAQGGFSPTDV
jgi:hypothetical protein